MLVSEIHVYPEGSRRGRDYRENDQPQVLPSSAYDAFHRPVYRGRVPSCTEAIKYTYAVKHLSIYDFILVCNAIN